MNSVGGVATRLGGSNKKSIIDKMKWKNEVFRFPYLFPSGRFTFLFCELLCPTTGSVDFFAISSLFGRKVLNQRPTKLLINFQIMS